MQSALNALNPVLSIRDQIQDVLKTHKNLEWKAQIQEQRTAFSC